MKLFLFLSLFPAFVWAKLPPTQQRIHQFFSAFDADSEKTMKALPKKYDAQGKRVLHQTLFSQKAIRDGSYIETKNRSRPRKTGQTFSGADEYNALDELLLTSKLVNVADLEARSPLEGKAKVQPWSADYWPTYKGGIANRYLDQSFPSSLRWKDYSEFFNDSLKHDFESEARLDHLSPAEKYDLLVGDDQRGLTKWSIQNSAESVDEKGNIETWFGLCHGWAAASFMNVRPRKLIEVRLPSGQLLPFYPDDLKALSTIAWGNGRFAKRFLGGRCDEKNPKVDENGRVVSDVCLDTNPATWHVTMLNRVGIDGKPFVMDAVYDYEVWNHPIVSYTVKYFNPNTRKEGSLNETMIPLSKYRTDKFKKYRAPQATSVVGVLMDVTYITEIAASEKKFDEESHDQKTTVEYVYDLEIDAEGKVIGGEWYQNAHPDFLWSPEEKAKIQNRLDPQIPWTIDQALTNTQKSAAVRSSMNGLPLMSIVDGLINGAQN
ncbi:MAG: peptidase [Proteobacteria bacterium]|jgi:hypothetical protein|nr:peptidase [Pseudomonadota bacterium]